MEHPIPQCHALCIDTCIYEAHGLAFDRGLLKQLDQFAQSTAPFVIPEIVYNELERHLWQRLTAARVKVARALRLAAGELSVSEEIVKAVEELLLTRDDDRKLGSTRLSDFCSRTKASIIRSSPAAMPRLVQMYFAATPPFEISGAKKSEFPDAIALLSLEEWAAANACKVLVVSCDQGLQDFCKNSPHLEFTPSLGDALAHFQPTNFAAALVDELLAQIASGDSRGILGEIAVEIAKAVEHTPVTADAYSTFFLEERYLETAYIGHDFVPEINIVSVSSEGVVIQLNAAVSCEITAEYNVTIASPFAWDRGPLGTRKVSTSKDFEVEIVVSVSGDFSRGLSAIRIGNIEIQGSPQRVHFGDVDPNPDDDE